eukprot:Em0016g1022a
MVREIQPHVIEICTSATARYRHIIQNTSASGNATDAELVAKFLQACIQSLSQCSQLLRTKVQSEELLPSMLMVIETSLAVGEACFSLCQWVEQQFSHTAKGLSQLFTSTCSLLKLSMEHLDLVSFGSCSDILVESIKAIIARLQLVCKVVMCFDASLMFLTWKGLGKLVCGAKPLLDSNWMVQPLVANLCAAVEAKARECIQCAPIGQETPCSSYSKLLKVCRFLATLLVKLVREFEDLSYEFCADIVHLLVTVHSVCPPSSLAKEVAPAIAQDVDTNVLILREPLISTLLQSPPFLLRLVRGTDVQKSQHFGWALCLSSLAKFFSKLSDGMKDQLMEADSSQEGRSTSCPMLDAFFSCMRECYVDLRVPILLPGVMCNGQAQSPVTLYDHICTHLCTLVTSLSARHYNQLEVVLLKNLLGEDPYCSLLASDVWCFLARWGTNETCIQHVHLLANLPASVPFIACLCSLHSLPLFPASVPFIACLCSLHNLPLFPSQPSSVVYPSLYVWGHSGTGKTLVIQSVLKKLQVQFAFVSCIDCYTPQLLFESALRQITATHSDPMTGRCDSMAKFVRVLSQVLNECGPVAYLVLDKAERVRDMEPTLLPSLMRLAELRKGDSKKSKRKVPKDKPSCQLQGPKPFPLDRMMAVFYSIMEDCEAPSTDVYSQISSLVTMQLVAQVGNGCDLDNPRYKCLVNLDFIRAVSRSVGFDIVQYLYDFV